MLIKGKYTIPLTRLLDSEFPPPGMFNSTTVSDALIASPREGAGRHVLEVAY